MKRKKMITILVYQDRNIIISVARGGQGGQLPPPPHNAFFRVLSVHLEICRYNVSRQACYLHRQSTNKNIERNSSFRM